MSKAKKLQNEQQFLISECKRHIESNKLSLWGYKAELSTLMMQYKKLKQSLETQEKQYFYLQKEVSEYTREMRACEEALNKANLDILSETSNPYPIVIDISTAICIQIGTQSPSWRGFRKLLKDTKSLVDALRSFNPSYISNEQMKYFASLYKKHNLSLIIKDSKLPEEFLAFASWFLNSFLYTQKDQESRVLCKKIIQFEKDAAKTYLEIKEISENIQDCENKLEKLLNCIEKAEKNISDLGNCGDDEFEGIRKNCEKIESTVKKSSIPDSMTGESNGPSILVESLFIQNNGSFNFDDLIEKSESKALISMEDMESSIPKESAHPIARIFPQKPRKGSKSKKRCCGFG